MIDRLYVPYWITLFVGVVGYWLVVTATGGPFASPLAPLALGSIFLGQLRADNRRALWLLFLGAVVALVASLALSELDFGMLNVDDLDDVDFGMATFILPWLLVAWMTSLVNDTTVFVTAEEMQEKRAENQA